MKIRFNMNWKNFFITLIIVGSIAGIVASAYSTLAHYDVASSGICTINETFDCDVVNHSKYSELFGIPVAVLGLVAYVFFFFTALMVKVRVDERILNLMVFTAVFGLLFSFYLTSIEAFVLYTWCILCLISQASIIAIAVGVFGLKKIDSKPVAPSAAELHQ